MTEKKKTTTTELKGLWPNLRAALAMASHVETTQSDGLKYDYVSEQNVISATREALVSHGILIVMSQVEPTFSTHTYSSWNSFQKKQVEKSMRCVDVLVTWALVHAPSGQTHHLQSVGSGVDMMEKGTAKAITSARKTLMQDLFMLVRGSGHVDDPTDDNGDGRFPHANDVRTELEYWSNPTRNEHKGRGWNGEQLRVLCSEFKVTKASFLKPEQRAAFIEKLYAGPPQRGD